MSAGDWCFLGYLIGIASHVVSAAGWYEYRRALGADVWERDDFYMLHCFTSLAWPISLPTFAAIVVAKRAGRKRLAALEEQQRIDAVVAEALTEPQP